jgi:hypothetical protein
VRFGTGEASVSRVSWHVNSGRSWVGVCGRRCDLDPVESKAFDLANDRGYRVVVIVVWVLWGLNPHPLKTERVRHPNSNLVVGG